MEKEHKKISLGFTSQQFDAGVHICQIFNDNDERHNAIINFIVSGMQAGEKTACFSEQESKTTLASFFAENGIEYNEAEQSGDFKLSKTAEVYFEGGEFEPDRMIDLLKGFYKKSIEQNHTGARVIGEMTPEVEQIKGGSRLLEYESKVNLLIKTCPVNAVCQYDARLFNGSTIMDILKVHPYMIIRGAVVRNPFFVQPEEFLAKNNAH
ncbi:MAG: MEDS domain-containing protein [Bacteroidales bacterium]|nr:MEDS domain-containing protein [Bacteroidales bacterium]